MNESRSWQHGRELSRVACVNAGVTAARGGQQERAEVCET